MQTRKKLPIRTQSNLYEKILIRKNLRTTNSNIQNHLNFARVTDTAHKMKFSIQDFFSNWDQIRCFLDLVTFTEEILNGKLHFLCSVIINFKKVLKLCCVITIVNTLAYNFSFIRAHVFTKIVKTNIKVCSAYRNIVGDDLWNQRQFYLAPPTAMRVFLITESVFIKSQLSPIYHLIYRWY